MILIKCTTGGYATDIFYTSDETETVYYHCTGQERTLANCSHEDVSSCYYGIRIACVYKNESGMCCKDASAK